MPLLEIKILYFKKYYIGNKGETGVCYFISLVGIPKNLKGFLFTSI